MSEKRCRCPLWVNGTIDGEADPAIAQNETISDFVLGFAFSTTNLPLALLVTALWLIVFFRVRSAFSGVFVERVP